MESFTGILIAGGKSERMGKDKALLFYRGKTFADQALKLLSLFCDRVVISSQHTDWPDTYEVIKDIYPVIGPIAGLHAGLKVSKTVFNLVLPCDLPLMEAGTLNRLVDGIGKSDAAIFRHEKFAEPLCGVYTSGSLPVIESQIVKGLYSLQELLSKLSVHYIDADENAMKHLRNINTPADYSTLTDFLR